MSATNFSATIARNSSPKVWSPVDHKEGEGALPVPWRRGRGADLVSLESNQVEEAGLKQRGPAMRFDHFSCGSVRIDRNTHKHDVIIRSPAKSASEKNRPRNFESSSATRRFRGKRKSPGDAANSSSAAVHIRADCPSC
jgi:hypothetical protein